VDRRAFVLFIVVDLLGVLGAVLVAVPFLREFGLKRLLNLQRLSVAISGFRRSQQSAQKVVEDALGKFKPGDGACVVWGLIVIAASYLLHILAEVIEYSSH
jgi:hypothetical protein